MGMNVVAHYAVLLALAIALEAPVYVLLLRGVAPVRRLVLAAFVINALTNPASNLIYRRWTIPIPVLELVVVAVEAVLLAMLFRCRPGRALMTSGAANLTSWVLGVPMYYHVMRLMARLVR